MPWRWDELSFGERKKLQIACALWQRPMCSPLTSRRNHLDCEARVAAGAPAHSFTGVGILVSHDRELLDALVDRCASFEPSGAARRGAHRRATRRLFRKHMQAERERAAATGERKRAKNELTRLTAEREQRAREAARADTRRSQTPPRSQGQKRTGQNRPRDCFRARRRTRQAAASDGRTHGRNARRGSARCSFPSATTAACSSTPGQARA